MWKVEHWYISGVHTGFRVVRRGPRGEIEINSGYVGNCYDPGSFEKAEADADSRCEELNAPYGDKNVHCLFGPQQSES